MPRSMSAMLSPTDAGGSPHVASLLAGHIVVASPVFLPVRADSLVEHGEPVGSAEGEEDGGTVAC